MSIAKSKIKSKLKYLVNRYPPIGKLLALSMSLGEVTMLNIGNFIDEHFSKFFLIRIFKTITKGKWGGRVVPLNVNIPVETKYLPTQEILEILNRAKVMAIGECYCRKKHKNCNNPTHTCIILGLGSERSLYDIPYRKIVHKHVSREQLVELLEDCDNRGLVHQLVFFPEPHYFYVICNCCPCCCTILHNYKRFLSPRIVSSDFIEQTNENMCKSCGTCAKICPFNARLVTNGKLTVDRLKCFGCGICVRKCPEYAIKLIKRNEIELTH